MRPIFPAPGTAARLVAGTLFVGVVLLVILSWVTNRRPPLYMVLRTEVSEIGVRIDAARRSAGDVTGPARRALLPAAARLRRLEWRGVRLESQPTATPGTLRIDATTDGPFAPALLVEGSVDLEVVPRKDDRLVVFVRAGPAGKLRLELEPTIGACIDATELTLPAEWLAADEGTGCRRASSRAPVLLLESAGDARLEIEADEPTAREGIFALPWSASEVRFEQLDPQDGSARRFVHWGSITLGVRNPIVTTLVRDASVDVRPSGRFLVTRLSRAATNGALDVEVVGQASSIRVGPEAESRLDVLPTQLEQAWHDESFRWWLGGLGGLVAAIGIVLSQIVGWYHQAWEFEISRRSDAPAGADEGDQQTSSRSVPASVAGDTAAPASLEVACASAAAPDPDAVASPVQRRPDA